MHRWNKPATAVVAAGLALLAVGCQKRVAVQLRNTSSSALQVSVQQMGQPDVTEIGTAEPGQSVEYLIVADREDLPRTWEFRWEDLDADPPATGSKAVTIQKTTKAPVVIRIPLGEVELD